MLRRRDSRGAWQPGVEASRRSAEEREELRCASAAWVRAPTIGPSAAARLSRGRDSVRRLSQDDILTETRRSRGENDLSAAPRLCVRCRSSCLEARFAVFTGNNRREAERWVLEPS